MMAIDVQRRTPIRVGGGEMVTFEAPASDIRLPSAARPAVRGVALAAWAAHHRPAIDAYLRHSGAILFRGFDIVSAPQLSEVVEAMFGETAQYEDQSSPRRPVSDRVYTSTDHPPDEDILLHNENAYSHLFPARICFCCATPASTGGETPLADSRKLLARIDPEVRAAFRRRGVAYVRNFHPHIGVSWQTAFQTDDPAALEPYFTRAGIEWEWRGDRLRVRQVRPAIARHPDSGEEIWFNQAHVFHVASLRSALRETLLASFDIEDLPTHATYADGTPIDAAVIAHIRDAYAAETVAFPWERGDLLVLDNMLIAHGRRAYSGARAVLVAMASPRSWAGCEARIDEEATCPDR
jgi:alpha-ketoglutarate-dependent taurine dioxygenase